MTDENISEENFQDKYDCRDLPKISNHFAHAYRVFAKCLWLFIIGMGAILIAALIFPVLKIFIHPAPRFRKAAQRFIHGSFVLIVFLLRIFGVAKTYTDSKEYFHNLHSKIIVANHPSLLDAVVLIFLMPNATTIAGEKYARGVFGGIIRFCYIINSMDLDELCARCKESLDLGNNVLIFPEGTRTPRHGQSQYKKGAARIAKATGADIVPVLIAGTDKYGLGKKNFILSYNPVEEWLYHVISLEEIKVSEYEEMSDQIAARKITQLYSERIRTAAEEYKKNHPLTKTVNNV